MEQSWADREAQPAPGLNPPFESALREALLRQEDAIAGFIRAAALQLELAAFVDAAASPDASSPASKPAFGPAAAERAASALADAARMAEALAELQRLALQLARTVGAGCGPAVPVPAPEDARGIRRSPPDKAAPAWFAAARGPDARR